ncbi:Carbonyl reductase [NADPH] 2 [Orchesella cincta]|uniref:Carbonyl reductase [NADPH] 2 n=1 Tax=Orchesella cincta TaxID=48709 RepID=A0A1D2MZM9_ORCCI|nr:Carbonyl reductase [NADPH] 2 [Orchesella cincta]
MSVKYDFTGHTVLVTGGGKGLGKTIVSKFIEAGCSSVYVVEKDTNLLKELEQEFPVIVKGVPMDVTNWDEVQKVVETLGPVNHLINNAGIPEPEDFMEITSEGIDKIFAVNFKAIVNISQIVSREMIKHGKKGSIVNISSVLDDRVIKGLSMYTCTKAAVTALTKSMALELAPHNIRVNCVRPSVMLTHLITGESKQEIAMHVFNTLKNRQVTQSVLTVEQTTDSVLFLCSDASSMVNGSSILVDGGLYTN